MPFPELCELRSQSPDASRLARLLAAPGRSVPSSGFPPPGPIPWRSIPRPVPPESREGWLWQECPPIPRAGRRPAPQPLRRPVPNPESCPRQRRIESGYDSFLPPTKRLDLPMRVAETSAMPRECVHSLPRSRVDNRGRGCQVVSPNYPHSKEPLGAPGDTARQANRSVQGFPGTGSTFAATLPPHRIDASSSRQRKHLSSAPEPRHDDPKWKNRAHWLPTGPEHGRQCEQSPDPRGPGSRQSPVRSPSYPGARLQ